MTRLFSARKPLITWERALPLACILSVTAVMSACGADATTPATSAAADDTAQAYEALSLTLQACEDQQATCATGDAAKVASCETEATACKKKAEAAAEHARENLARDTNSCWKRCAHSDDDAGAVSGDDDGNTEDMHSCIEHHAPPLPGCVRGFLNCLHDAGVKKGNASRDKLVACIQEADACFHDELAARRAQKRGHGGRDGRGDEAGKGAAGSAPAAGSPAVAGSGGAGSFGRSGSSRGR